MNDDPGGDDSDEVQHKSDRGPVSSAGLPGSTQGGAPGAPFGAPSSVPTPTPTPTPIPSSASPDPAAVRLAELRAARRAGESGSVRGAYRAAPPAVAPAVAPPVVPAVAPAGPESDADVDDEEEGDDDLPLTIRERVRRLPPAPILLSIGSIGALLFLLKAVTSHTTPVSVLLSASVVVGLVFGIDAVVASVATWRAGRKGESGWAIVLAICGGLAGLICAGSFAGMVVMILLLNS